MNQAVQAAPAAKPDTATEDAQQVTRWLAEQAEGLGRNSGGVADGAGGIRIGLVELTENGQLERTLHMDIHATTSRFFRR